MLFTPFTVLLGMAACVCDAHTVCSPGTLCAVTTPPICKATPPVLRQTPPVRRPIRGPPVSRPTPPVRRPNQASPVRRPIRPLPVPNPEQTLPCIHDAYLVFDNILHSMNLKTGETRTMNRLDTKHPAKQVDAVGYNPKDNYLYGTQHNILVRIFANGTTEDVLKLPIFPNIGAFDEHGRYWCSARGSAKSSARGSARGSAMVNVRGKQWASVDLDPDSPGYKHVENGVSTFPDPSAYWPHVDDWASSPVDPAHLYGIGVSSRPGGGHPTLVRWKKETKAWEKVYVARHLSKGNTFGAVMSTGDGIIFGLDSVPGNLVRFNLYDHASTSERNIGAMSAKHVDGTRCLTLPE